MENSKTFAIICTLLVVKISAIPILQHLQEDDPVHVVCKPSEDGLPVFIPHPYECNKYFECQPNDPVAVAMTCPAGLVFDPALEVCNWPWALDPPCVNTPYPTLPTTTMIPETSTTPDIPSTTMPPSTMPPTTMPPTTLPPTTL